MVQNLFSVDQFFVSGMQMQRMELDGLECSDTKAGQDNEEEEDDDEEDGEQVDASIPELVHIDI